jgi:putative tricarboxylic transport membrane protein
MAISVIFFAMTFQIKVIDGLYEPGPRIIPYLAEAITFFTALLMTINARGNEKNPDMKESKAFLTREGWKRLGLAFAMMLGYTILLSLVGYLIATPIASLVFIYVLSGRKKVNFVVAIVITAILTIGIYFLFTKGFSISLPKGLLKF